MVYSSVENADSEYARVDFARYFSLGFLLMIHMIKETLVYFSSAAALKDAKSTAKYNHVYVKGFDFRCIQ